MNLSKKKLIFKEMKKMSKLKVVKILESLSGIIFLGVLLKYGFNSEGFRYATISMMITLSVLVVYAKIVKVPLTPMQSSAWILTMTLGSLSVFLDNPIYYKLKTTFLYWGGAFFFLVSHMIGKKTILERLLDPKIKAPRKLLRKISLQTIIYLTLAAFANYYLATYASIETWTYFKYGVLLGLNFVYLAFVLYQLKDYLKEIMEETSK